MGRWFESIRAHQKQTFLSNSSFLWFYYVILIKLSNTENCLDCFISDEQVGEIRITTHYFDEELIWTAYILCLPSFYILGYVLGMNYNEIVSKKAPYK